ncbi:unnamed protein product [Acanthoscelides obtectus]|uniref:Uncharacterized protein n=1 Tax=Acanthoscelides obtectus TaxID=200917 RepID=A0A9P0VNV6_ACAOB|nr:unnamed protein product [Acanthoscelides obtectus]CAK1626859.1 hypothetical protein AOBTE_LOCUS4119 [Acanthoscelides obtectus]
MAASDECKLLRKIFKKCPLLFSLFCTEKQSHKKLKIIVGRQRCPKAVVITFIIAGPVENLGNNGKEVVRVFACTTSLTFNLTKTRFELMFKPFTQAIFGMKTGVDEIKDTVKSIKDVSAPVIGEIEDEKEVRKMKEENDYIDELVGDTKRSELMNQKYETVGEQAEAEKFEKNVYEEDRDEVPESIH